MKILVGGEIFFRQATGGISRIYQKTLPCLLREECVEKISIIETHEPPAYQSFEHLADRVLGIWLRSDRRPFRFRKMINRNYCAPLNNALFRCMRASVYLPTYYSLPPRGIPSVCFVHDLIHERYPELLPPIEREFASFKANAIKAAARLQCNSNSTKNDLISFYGIDPSVCDVVHLGGGEYKAPPTALCKVSQDALRLLYVGDWWSEYKNFDFLLRSLNVCSNIMRNRLELHVVARRQIHRSDMEKHALLSGNRVFIKYYTDASDEKLSRLYHTCDAFVYPSLWEGFGIPIAEALSWGCAVACSDIPVFHEVGGDVVDYFDPYDVDSVYRAIHDAITSGRDLDVVQQRTAWASQFTWKNTAKTMLMSLGKVVQNINR